MLGSNLRYSRRADWLTTLDGAGAAALSSDMVESLQHKHTIYS